jgi:hypothetical protein
MSSTPAEHSEVDLALASAEILANWAGDSPKVEDWGIESEDAGFVSSGHNEESEIEIVEENLAERKEEDSSEESETDSVLQGTN